MKTAVKLLIPLAKSSETYETPDYANAGGTGNRTASITVTETLVGTGAPSLLVNGTIVETVHFWNSGQAILNKIIKFDFGTKRLITEAKWYESAAGTTEGNWQWQGSNDDSTYTNIGSPFTLGGLVTQTQTELSTNTKGYRYYRLLGISGTSSNAVYQREVEFKIGNLL